MLQYTCYDGNKLIIKKKNSREHVLVSQLLVYVNCSFFNMNEILSRKKKTLANNFKRYLGSICTAKGTTKDTCKTLVLMFNVCPLYIRTFWLYV